MRGIPGGTELTHIQKYTKSTRAGLADQVHNGALSLGKVWRPTPKTDLDLTYAIASIYTDLPATAECFQGHRVDYCKLQMRADDFLTEWYVWVHYV